MDQWLELSGFFALKGDGPKVRTNTPSKFDSSIFRAVSRSFVSATRLQGDAQAKELATLFDSSNKLYLIALRTILSGVQKVSKAFEKTNADVTKLYADLRSQILVLAGRILKPQALAQTARPGMLRSDEAKSITESLNKREFWQPTDRISLGESFARTAHVEKVSAEDLGRIKQACGQYIFTLCNDLLGKLPSNLDSIEKLRFLTPRMALARTARPTFQQLPTEMAGMCNTVYFKLKTYLARMHGYESIYLSLSSSSQTIGLILIHLRPNGLYWEHLPFLK